MSWSEVGSTETRSSWKALSSAVTSLGGGWEREAEVKVTTKVTSSRRPKEKYCILAMIVDLVVALFDRVSVWGVIERDAEFKSCFSGSASLLPLAEIILLTRNYAFKVVLKREYA